MRRKLVFQRLDGGVPGPTNDIRLSIDMASAKSEFCATRIGEFRKVGEILRGELDSLTGRLSFSQTSIFAMFGMATTKPLYRKLYAVYYQAELSGNDRIALEG